METSASITPYGAFPEKAPIEGHIGTAYPFVLRWHPHYMKEFPAAIKGVTLPWKKFKFQRGDQNIIPNDQGIYCFSVLLGSPLPQEIHIPLYIGKAAPGTLRERFKNYLKEKRSRSGRKKIIHMLDQYSGQLHFWCAIVPKWGYVDAIEKHLIWACCPPCNTHDHLERRERLWGKAFEDDANTGDALACPG